MRLRPSLRLSKSRLKQTNPSASSESTVSSCNSQCQQAITPKETGAMSTHDALLLALGYAWGVALMGAGWWLLG